MLFNRVLRLWTFKSIFKLNVVLGWIRISFGSKTVTVCCAISSYATSKPARDRLKNRMGPDADPAIPFFRYLRSQLCRPLVEQSETGETQVHKTIDLLHSYDFLREDFDSIQELGQYPGLSPLMSKVGAPRVVEIIFLFDNDGSLC